MKKNGYWFYLEPYVHVVVRRDAALLYNTVNGERIETSDPDPLKLIRALQHYMNQGVIYLDEETHSQKEIKTFIEEVREKYIGDIIDVTLFPEKPIQFTPIPKLYKGTVRQKSDPLELPAENILSYVQFIYLKINNGCGLSCSDCPYAYLQNFHCSSRGATEMYIHQIEQIKQILDTIPLQRLYITGGNIFKHSGFVEIIKLFEKVKDYCTFGFHYLNMPEKQILEQLVGYHLELFIPPPYDVGKIQKYVQELDQYELNYLIKLAVTSSDDVTAYHQLAEIFPEHSMIPEPLFTGNNYAFFDESIFLDREDIFESPIPMHQIFANQILNKNFFGSLYVESDGTVRSNPNNKGMLGNIFESSLYSIIAEELIHNHSWKKIRNKKPCSECLYNALCPSVSNYELALNRYDLCHINE